MWLNDLVFVWLLSWVTVFLSRTAARWLIGHHQIWQSSEQFKEKHNIQWTPCTSVLCRCCLRVRASTWSLRGTNTLESFTTSPATKQPFRLVIFWSNVGSLVTCWSNFCHILDICLSTVFHTVDHRLIRGSWNARPQSSPFGWVTCMPHFCLMLFKYSSNFGHMLVKCWHVSHNCSHIG